VVLTSGVSIELGPRAVHPGVPLAPAVYALPDTGTGARGGGDRLEKGVRSAAKNPGPR
jgi:hypothetical protein